MRRRMQRASGRQRGGSYGGDVDIPLPTAGLFAEARTSEIPGIYAGGFQNWRSNGTAIETRPQVTYRAGNATARQRIPYEFGALSAIISLQEAGASATDWASGSPVAIADIVRPWPGLASTTYISANLVIADGTGAPVLFNGATFSTGAFTTVTGVDAATFDGVVAHHDRLFFWDSDGPLEFYYGGVGAITGALTRFPLSRLGSITGSIMAMLSLTVDAGNGLDDVLCIITTTGQMVLYQGLDPGDANDWQMVSRVKAGAPVSKWAFDQVGTDVWMVTGSGVVSVLESIASGTAALVSQLSRPIADDIIRAVEGGIYDWQIHVSADGSMVIINAATDEVARQWVYYAESTSWATADFPALHWFNIGTETRFTGIVTGYDGKVGRIPDSAGEVISAQWHTSWFRLGKQGTVVSIRPTIVAYAPLSITVTVLADHNETASDVSEAVQTVALVPDTPADAGGTIAFDEIIPVDAVGHVFSVRIEVSAPWVKIVAMQARVV